MPRPTTLSVDLAALSHNAAVTRRFAGNSKILASVKANAYGHGIIPCSEVLSQSVDGFAVAFCEEAVGLRQHNIALPLLVLEGPFDRADVEAIKEHDLMMTLHSHHQIDLLEKAGYQYTTPLWIKVDTGMHRLGFSPAEAPQVIKRLRQLGADSMVLMSHYADGENPSSSCNPKPAASVASTNSLDGFRIQRGQFSRYHQHLGNPYRLGAPGHHAVRRATHR